MDINTLSMLIEFDKVLEEYKNICISFDDIITFVNSLQLSPKDCPVGYKIDDKYFYIITKCKNSSSYTVKTHSKYYVLFDKDNFDQQLIPYITSVVDLLFIDNGYNIVTRSKYSKIYKTLVDKDLLVKLKLSIIF